MAPWEPKNTMRYCSLEDLTNCGLFPGLADVFGFGRFGGVAEGRTPSLEALHRPRVLNRIGHVAVVVSEHGVDDVVLESHLVADPPG